VKVLGINALYHDPAAALVVDGTVVAAAEEERFSRRKHGKRPLPWSAWELPELSAAWVLAQAGLSPADLDAVAYSFDPRLMPAPEETGLGDQGDVMRKMYAEQAPSFLAHYLPAWGKKSVVLVGYSRGADVLPSVVAQLTPEQRKPVLSLALIAASQEAELEIHVMDLVG